MRGNSPGSRRRIGNEINYNDAECAVHNISWQSSEIGTDCPACEAENVIHKVIQQAKRWISPQYSPLTAVCGNKILGLLKDYQEAK